MLALMNASFDILYAVRTPYIMKMVFMVTWLFLVARGIAILVSTCYYYYTYVINFKTRDMAQTGESRVVADDDQAEADEMGKSQSKKDKQIIEEGKDLYSSMLPLLLTGFFRLLPIKDFYYELCLGYSIELFL